MQEIGSGWQYRVYDLENGRVRKLARSFADQYRRIVQERPYKLFIPLSVVREVRRIDQVTEHAITGLQERMDIAPGYLFGNPAFIGGMDYEQDKVVTLREYMVDHDLEDNKRVLEQYAVLIVELWKYGLGENVYNFLTNNGIDAAGRVIHIDIAEYTFSREDAMRHVQKKSWLFQDSYRFLISSELKQHYCQVMEKTLTRDVLSKVWGIYSAG